MTDEIMIKKSYENMYDDWELLKISVRNFQNKIIFQGFEKNNLPKIMFNNEGIFVKYNNVSIPIERVYDNGVISFDKLKESCVIYGK